MSSSASSSSSRVSVHTRTVASASSSSPPTKITFAHHADMARLPVPALDATLDKYLASVEPLVSPAKFQRTKELVERFRTSEEASRLQAKLVEHAANPEVSNWLEGWWSDMYFELRDPNPSVNYLMGFVDDPSCKTWLERAARLVTSALKFKTMLDSETLEPDRRKDGTPLSMDQFRNMFGCVRIPHPSRDFFERYPNSRHIVVLFRNRFFSVDVLSEAGEFLPTTALQQALEHIVASDPTAGPGIGALTAEERTHWGEVYAWLSAKNQATLKKVESAIVALCLDEAEPSTPTEWARTLIHGDCQNRWFEKLNIIVCKNKYAGVNSEHSSLDGHNLLRLVNFLVEDSRVSVEAAGPAWETATPQPEELTWKLDNRLLTAVDDACSNAEAMCESIELDAFIFKYFGKRAIVKHKMSPDAFAQMALQLAFYKHFGRQGPTYEPATTRAFLHGRTETIRSVTKEAVTFVKTMVDPAASEDAKVQTLLSACARHAQLGNESAAGKGCDRHMFGLRKMAADGPMPDIFTDPSFAASCNWVLSTSHCGSENLSGFAFFQVVPNGLGVGYMVNNDHMIFTTTSKWIGSRVFNNLLQESMLEMMSLFESQAKL